MSESNRASSASDMIRCCANYHPSIWGDYFLKYSASHLVEIDCGMMEQHKQLKEEVRQMIMATTKELPQKLNFIDVVFQDKDGKFKESLTADVRGMLSLYQASYLGVKGEDILDEALCFTTTHLQCLAVWANPLSAEVTHALNQPIRMGFTRLEARHFMWWKGLDVAKKLPFVRDRIVECYFWTLGVYFEPKYFMARRILTKMIALTSIIDDIYDAYGTFEELVSFHWWENNAKDQLPMWMRVCYQALLDFYNMIDEEMAREGKSYRVDHATAAMKDLAQAYFIEAKWYHEGYVPNMEEYMGVALVSCGYRILAITSFIGIGDLVTKQSFDWISSNPLIVEASSVICRLMDNMVSHKFEQKRGHVVSAVECYMKEYGASEEGVHVHFNKRVADAWKNMNAEMLQPTAVPMPLLERILNFARVIHVLYKDEDGYTNSGGKTKDFVTSLLVDPAPMHPPYSADLPP
ncbi:unnamed protein product [Thlaspi arvense]|uniref:Uncharacterized protein n=1 Tax=Thlaspi arvense TaxID=13288 RepID=A0AAU9RKG6_THLAR|nr:unnamed protein product [Thlaspi arvense]